MPELTESEVIEYTKKLKAKLREEGDLPEDMVRGWLEDEGLSAGQINLVFGQGSRRGKYDYYKEDGWIYPGPRPGVDIPTLPTPTPSPVTSNNVPASIEAMEDPKDQFAQLAIEIGIPEAKAKQAAHFCFNSFDMIDPKEAWKAIGRTQIPRQQRNNIWTTWMSFNHIEVPEDHNLFPRSPETQSPPVQDSSVNAPSFLAIDGEIERVENNDPAGVSHGQALLQAKLQVERGRPMESAAPPATGMLEELIRQQGATDRKRMELEASKAEPVVQQNNGGFDIQGFMALQQAMFERQREVDMTASDRRAQDAERAHERMLELITTQHAQHLDILQQQPDQPSFLEQAEEVLTSKLFDKILNPPVAVAPGVTVKLPGDGGEISLDAYERLQNINNRNTALVTAREALPELIEVGREILAERKEEKARERAEVGKRPPELQPEYFEGKCVECGLVVVFQTPNGFQCPTCETYQTRDGQIVQVPEAAQEAAQEPAQEPETTQEQEPVQEAETQEQEPAQEAMQAVVPFPVDPNAYYPIPDRELEDSFGQELILTGSYFIPGGASVLPATEAPPTEQQVEVEAEAEVTA